MIWTPCLPAARPLGSGRAELAAPPAAVEAAAKTIGELGEGAAAASAEFRVAQVLGVNLDPVPAGGGRGELVGSLEHVDLAILLAQHELHRDVDVLVEDLFQ